MQPRVRRRATHQIVCFAFFLLGTAQRLREYNLWVCPHCDGGAKPADVTDLGCEALSSAGTNWSWVKQALFRFLRNMQPGIERQQNSQELEKLVHLALGPVQGECYLGIVALGFFTFHFMDAEERKAFIQTTVFGGVTFQRIVPLSYWDVYASGWPIFSLLATAGEGVRQDLEMAARSAGTLAEKGEHLRTPATGLTGINLGPRSCCDFPGSPADVEDRAFLFFLQENLGMTRNDWVQGKGSIPVQRSLDYLASTAYRQCSWGRAAAYFALTEAMLAAPGGSSAKTWNSTKALMSLGEHNLDGCEPNMTVYHLMQSAWPFWQILGRLEQRHLPLDRLPAPAATELPTYVTPPVVWEAVQFKWRHLQKRLGIHAGVSLRPMRNLHEDVAAGAHERGAIEVPSPASGSKATALIPPRTEQIPQTHHSQQRSCIEGGGENVHVALAADIKQIDGLIITLNSATLNAGINASRLCLHAFVLPHELDFVVQAIICAFGADIQAIGTDGHGTLQARIFRLKAKARLLIHCLDAELVWQNVGMSRDGRGGETPAKVMHGEVDLSTALHADIGNLGSVHNFVRFVLHEMLPALPRVVYLDVDVLVKGNLCELYDTALLASDDGVGTIAAVQRTNQPLRVYVDVLQPAVPMWLPSEAPSFNAGVLVIDLGRWRERQVSSFAARWIALNAQRHLWLHGSQPPLLLLFHDEVVPLHWTWNVDGLGHRLNYPKDVVRQAKVLHWTGPLKPWKHHGVNRLLWEPYALEYCPKYSFREHTTTCRPDSWFC